MSNDKISSADDLVKATKSADAELAEYELANTTGGKAERAASKVYGI